VSNLVYPGNLPGLSFGSVRIPTFNTGVQQALSSKESRIAYQQYPQMQWELTYELLRDYVAPSDLKALFGLYMAVGGKFDTFLYEDPQFNTVKYQQFGVTDGTTLTFQTTAVYQNAGGPGAPELIQNLNSAFGFEINRFGGLIEYPYGASRTQFALFSADFTNAIWSKSNMTALIASQAAPDGTSTANVFNDSTSSSVIHDVAQFCSGTSPAGVYTFSVFVWAGAVESSFIWLQIDDSTASSSATGVFNKSTGAFVSTGIVGGSFSAMSASTNAVVSVSGSNWYRLSITVTKTSANAISSVVYATQSATVAAYAGTSGVAAMVLWGAQIENAALFAPIDAPTLVLPTMYLPTTTAAITQQDWVGISPTLQISINSAHFGAFAGINLLWTGSFFYRVRFDDDSLDFSEFMNEFWEVRKVKLKQIKL
jgi:hypothetical protein